jgi:hypothetical protein
VQPEGLRVRSQRLIHSHLFFSHLLAPLQIKTTKKRRGRREEKSSFSSFLRGFYFTRSFVGTRA